MENNELIPGEWYDFTGKANDNKIAAKYTRTSINTRDVYFHFSEYIRKDRREVYNGNWNIPKVIRRVSVHPTECRIIEEPNYQIY